MAWLITLAVDDPAMDPQGAKEAAAMAAEHLGGVRVVQVDVLEPEQLGLSGVIPERRPAPANLPAHPPEGRAQASTPTRKPGGSEAGEMACCMRCVHYQKQGGRDESGKFYWGLCRRTGRPVYRLIDQCRAWEGRW